MISSSEKLNSFFRITEAVVFQLEEKKEAV